MWFVTLKNKNRMTPTVQIVVHADGTNPVSLCQAVRLVREELVRIGKEDDTRITAVEFRVQHELLMRTGEAK